MSYRLVQITDCEVTNIARDPQGFAGQLLLTAWNSRHGHPTNKQCLVSVGKDVGTVVYQHRPNFVEGHGCGIVMAGDYVHSHLIHAPQDATVLDAIEAHAKSYGYKLTPIKSRR